jgi:hypothetical protein
MDSLFDSLETDSIEIINHIFDLLDDLETEINDLNISQSEMDSILSLKDNVENNATSLINTITDSNNLSISVSDDLVSLINSLSQNLAELKSRLSTSASSKSLSLDKVVSLKDGLDSSSSDLVSLKDSIDNVKNSLLTISLRNAEDIVNPLITEIKPVVTQRSHLNYFFPSLIALVIMFIAVLLASSLVMMEKTSRASFRNNITPTNGLIFFFSTYITCMIIMVFQLSILFMISILAFNLPLSIFSTNFLTILSLLLLISTGYLFKSRETSTLGAVSLSSIFFIISDLIIPIESMPEHVLQFAKFNPFMISSNLLRNSILFNKSIFSLGSGFITLLIYIIVLFIVSLLLMKFFRNQHLLKLHLPRRKKK